MFDVVFLEDMNMLPGHRLPDATEFQTKSLECFLWDYMIRKDGSLHKKESGFFGEDGHEWQKIYHSGEVRFYHEKNDFIAIFSNGVLQFIEGENGIKKEFSFQPQGFEHPRVGIGVFIRKNGQYLLMQRMNSHGSGTWALPGGKLDHGESFAECACREVMEETGLTITNPTLITATNNVMANGMHWITLVMSADHVSGEPTIMEAEKCSAMGWFDPSSFPKPLFEPLETYLKQHDLP